MDFGLIQGGLPWLPSPILGKTPEAPEIRVFAEWLQANVGGKYLFSIDILKDSRYAKTGTFDGQQYLTQFCLVQKVIPRGKKIVFYLQRTDGQSLLMVSSLGMAGWWGRTKGNHTSLKLHFGSMRGRFGVVEEVIYYEDQRRFGSLVLAQTPAEIAHVFKDVGPDLLNEEVTLEQYTQIIRNGRISKKPLCQFLMDQGRVSGVGNYIRNEAMYRAKLAPSRTLGSLSDQDVANIHHHCIAVMRESYNARGNTIASYRDPCGSKGSFRCVVYKCKQDPYGNPVVAEKVGTDPRTTHWVPAVQI